jgi:predicted phosphodiesterase
MYKWKIKLILKSGKETLVYYCGDEQSSNELAEKLLPQCLQENTFSVFGNEDSSEAICVKMCEVVCMSFSVA